MIKHKLLIFSSNFHKIKEIKKIIPKNKYNIITLKNLKNLKLPKETGKSFKENAIIKSKFGYKIFKIPSIADDSGICIDALNGKPGIHSKRYQKKFGGINKTVNKIINIVKKTKKIGQLLCVLFL